MMKILNSRIGIQLSSIGNVSMQRRQIWGWLNTIFNKVDTSRIKDVGPDRACAEWLIRCGASVRWTGSNILFNDYNSLPASGYRTLKIEEINATDSAVMDVGFPHFFGLEHVRKIIFHKCAYLTDDALGYLGHLHKTLNHLQISSCGNITEGGLMTLCHLSKLQYLLLYDLPEINKKENTIAKLQKCLPHCKIDFPYAQASELDTLATIERALELKEQAKIKKQSKKK